MFWLSLVIALIQAIPALIDIIKRITDKIHGHPDQLANEQKLRGIVLEWVKHKDAHKVEQDLLALDASLV